MTGDLVGFLGAPALIVAASFVMGWRRRSSRAAARRRRSYLAREPVDVPLLIGETTLTVRPLVFFTLEHSIVWRRSVDVTVSADGEIDWTGLQAAELGDPERWATWLAALTAEAPGSTLTDSVTFPDDRELLVRLQNDDLRTLQDALRATHWKDDSVIDLPYVPLLTSLAGVEAMDLLTITDMISSETDPSRRHDDWHPAYRARTTSTASAR